MKHLQQTVLGFVPNHVPPYYKHLVFWLHKCANTVYYLHTQKGPTIECGAMDTAKQHVDGEANTVQCR